MLLYLFFFLCSGVAGEHYDWDKSIADSGVSYDIRLVDPPVLLINKNVTPVAEAENMESNNNVAAKLYNGRLFLAWRTAPVHFASAETRLHIVSRPVNETDWELEKTIFLGSDMREPMFMETGGKLNFTFFEGGTNPIDFEPKGLFQMQRREDGSWTQFERFGHAGEVIWEVVEENGTLYGQSYSGDYSTPGDATDLGMLDLFFNKSDDGMTWGPLGASTVYHGGLTEVGFGFDLEGNLWGVARNEDGDDSGWGSRVFTARAGDYSQWQFLKDESDPVIYESPKMFRHGSELFLVARTDPAGPFWSKDNPLLNILPAWEHHLIDLVSFSLRQHGTAIWRLNLETGGLEEVLELVGCGDTAFPSIVRVSEHRYIIFNYSSSIDGNCPPNWIMGQVSPAGSVIYSQVIEFVEV